MYRKFKNKWLIILLIVLMIIVALIELKDYFKGDRSFRALVLGVDTAKVNALIISDPAVNNPSLKIFKDQGQWKVTQNSKTYKADEGMVKNLIEELARMKPEWLAATGREKWAELQVNDSLGIKVLVEEKGKKKSQLLIIGKFSYQQPSNPYDRQGRMSTYVRVGDENEVYAVTGFLRMSYTSDINAFRNKSLIKSSSDDWLKLTFIYPGDSSFVLQKQDKKWMINESKADSSLVAQYLSNLERLSAYEFADTIRHAVYPQLSLKIEGKNMLVPLEITAYPSDSKHKFVIHSSFNPDAWFSGFGDDLAAKIFKGKKQFMK